MVSAALPVLSPLVTRILQVSGFSSDLKTRDISAVFSPWEDDHGGFKIKWVDDTTVLVVFADAGTAKKAYLNTLADFPTTLIEASGKRATIRPYDGDDAAAVIQSVHHRTRSRSNANNILGSPSSPVKSLATLPGGASSSPVRHRHTGSNVSLSGISTTGSVSRSTGTTFTKGHLRHPSGSNPSSLPPKPIAAALYDAAKGGPSPAHHLQNAAREQGVTLPLPASLALNTADPSGSATQEDMEHLDSAVDAPDAPSNPYSRSPQKAGRVGDAGRRLVAGALGVRHPALDGRANGVNAPPAADRAAAAATLPQAVEGLKLN